MTGAKYYYKIPLLTKWFKIRFYIKYIDDKFHHTGFERDTMTLAQAIQRLEAKRIRRGF